MAALFLATALKQLGEQGLDVCARMFVYDNPKQADLVTYRLRETGAVAVERLAATESKRIFNRNLDGLKKGVRIVKFL